MLADPFAATGGDITWLVEFAGWGGDSQGANVVPGVELTLAANHDPVAIEHHSLNFPHVDHQGGDIEDAEIEKWPACVGFWCSPACPTWTDARGVKRDFDKINQTTLFGPEGPEPNVARSRALMEQVPRYLRAMSRRGQPVMIGVVENVIQCRKWSDWQRWIREIKTADEGGYEVRVIALNSMHAEPVRTKRAPQSRNRLYVAYWHRSLRRSPDWDKWLRPRAYCAVCDRVVQAVQSWKDPRNDMGTYGRYGQYVYRCPSATCRHRQVYPGVLPALAIIDWSIPGQRIGDRAADDPLAPKTRARIAAGLRKFADPITLAASGGTIEMRHYDAGPPLVVPLEGRNGVAARPVTEAFRTQTGRAQDGLVIPLRAHGTATLASAGPLPAFAASGTHHGFLMRNNSSHGDGREHCTPLADPMRTLTTAGHQSLVYAYDTGALRRAADAPLPGQTTHGGDALLRVDLDSLDPAEVDALIDDCLFRMLTAAEIRDGMAFFPQFKTRRGLAKRWQIRGYGNAVTPPCAEVIVSALVECLTGVELERYTDEYGLAA